VGAFRGAHRVDRDPHRAVGAVLEADRAGEARGQFAVPLALGRARADRAPADQVGDVLRTDQVEELGAGGQAHPVDLEQQLARQVEPLVDLEALVEVRVVDQPLPADRGTRLLEVDPHHDQQVVARRVRARHEAARVGDRGVGVVHRARADDDQQPVVGARQDVVDRASRAGDRVGGLRGDRVALVQDGGRLHFLDGAYAQVVGLLHR
jgi:hypothetical protein